MLYLRNLLFISLFTVLHSFPAKNDSASQCQTLHSGTCLISSNKPDTCTIPSGDSLCDSPEQVCCIQNPSTTSTVATTKNAVNTWHPGCGVNKFNNSFNHGTRKVRRSKRVIGGVESAIGQFPWQVALLIETVPKCGGVLINGWYVLTAAHCVECSPGSEPNCDLELHHEVMMAALSLTQPTPNTRTVLIENAVIHPDYDSTTLENDIALLRLNRDISGDIMSNVDINTVCAPDPTFDYDGMICYLSGWGKTGYPLGPQSDTLQYVDLPVINQETCCSAHCSNCNSGDCTVFDHNICAGYEEGGKDACSGDSGGPLICSVNNRYSVIGINSWGNGCARPSKPGVYVSVVSFLDWIDQVINTA